MSACHRQQLLNQQIAKRADIVNIRLNWVGESSSIHSGALPGCHTHVGPLPQHARWSEESCSEDCQHRVHDGLLHKMCGHTHKDVFRVHKCS